jgi:hypothetical protein
MLRHAALALTVCGALVLLLPSGSAGSATSGACGWPRAPKGCLYDIELAAETRLPDIGVFGLTARFRRVSVVHNQTPPAYKNPKPVSLSIGLGSRHRNLRMTGTVTGALDIRTPDCIHKRTYPAIARAELSGHVSLGGLAGGGAGLGLELAPTREIPPQWAPTCSLYQQQNRDLAFVMFAVGNQLVLLTGPGTTGHLSVGQGSNIGGSASLAAVYSMGTKRRQASEAKLSSPWRELWAGRSAVVRQRATFDTPRGDAVTNVRLSLTRRR